MALATYFAVIVTFFAMAMDSQASTRTIRYEGSIPKEKLPGEESHGDLKLTFEMTFDEAPALGDIGCKDVPVIPDPDLPTPAPRTRFQSGFSTGKVTLEVNSDDRGWKDEHPLMGWAYREIGRPAQCPISFKDGDEVNVSVAASIQHGIQLELHSGEKVSIHFNSPQTSLAHAIYPADLGYWVLDRLSFDARAYQAIGFTYYVDNGPIDIVPATLKLNQQN